MGVPRCLSWEDWLSAGTGTPPFGFLGFHEHPATPAPRWKLEARPKRVWPSVQRAVAARGVAEDLGVRAEGVGRDELPQLLRPRRGQEERLVVESREHGNTSGTQESEAVVGTKAQ